MPLARTYQDLTLSLEIDGAQAGSLKDASGGDWQAEVVTTSQAGGAGKHLGIPTIAPIIVTVAHAERGAIWTWIAAAVSGTQTRHSGAVVFTGTSSSDSVRLEWLNGAITRVTFPSADGASKEPALVVVEISPERTNWVRAQTGPKSAVGGKTKATIRANFGIDISGLSGVGKSAVALSGVSVRIPQAEDEIGEHRIAVKDLQPPVVSDVAITLGGAGIADAATWFDDVVVKGKASATDGRTMTVTFFDASLKGALLSFELGSLLPFRRELSDTPFSTGAGARTVLHCYAERLTVVTPSPVGSKPADPVPSATEPATILSNPVGIARTIDPSVVVRPTRPTLPG